VVTGAVPGMTRISAVKTSRRWLLSALSLCIRGQRLAREADPLEHVSSLQVTRLWLLPRYGVTTYGDAEVPYPCALARLAAWAHMEPFPSSTDLFYRNVEATFASRFALGRPALP
jgi:hypothetical protein